MNIDLTVTKKQKAFIDSKETEVLFGGAAGGGKSYGQIADALLFALKYPASKQLILRRTFPELEKSIIANLADDVIVSVKGKKVEIVIIKEFKKEN